MDSDFECTTKDESTGLSFRKVGGCFATARQRLWNSRHKQDVRDGAWGKQPKQRLGAKKWLLDIDLKLQTSSVYKGLNHFVPADTHMWLNWRTWPSLGIARDLVGKGNSGMTDCAAYLYQSLQKHLRDLPSMGAHSEEPDALYGSVTGFPFGLDEPAINRGLRGPEALRPSKKLRVLWWGSPHPGPSSSRAHVESHGRASCSTAFKTNAFHSMAWTCSGLVAMCFPDKYKVEFRQPRSLRSSNRQLIVALAFCREYVPMCSGNDERYAIPSAAIDRTMIAMLLPSEDRMRVIYRDNGAVDIGMTLLNYVDNLTDDEYAVALGCYDC